MKGFPLPWCCDRLIFIFTFAIAAMSREAEDTLVLHTEDCLECSMPTSPVSGRPCRLGGLPELWARAAHEHTPHLDIEASQHFKSQDVTVFVLSQEFSTTGNIAQLLIQIAWGLTSMAA